MAEKLKSIWKSQLSSLALKLVAVFAALTWYRHSADMSSVLVFGALYWFWYFRPSINNKKFLASAAINFILALFLPIFPDARLNALIVLGLVAIYGILIGVKNLIFFERDKVYYLGQFLLVSIFSLFILLGQLSLFNEIIIGIGLALLFREFYLFLAPNSKNSGTLAGLVSAFLAIQLGWVISVAPKVIWVKVGLLTLLIFMMMELTAQHLKGELAISSLKRDLIIALVGIGALFVL